MEIDQKLIWLQKIRRLLINGNLPYFYVDAVLICLIQSKPLEIKDFGAFIDCLQLHFIRNRFDCGRQITKKIMVLNNL
jgi:hypothetical protein